MFTVAIVGADGAGKTAVCRRLERELPARVKYIYMGVNRDSSNHMLPTTRLIRLIKRATGAQPDTAGPPDCRQPKERPGGLVRRTFASLRAALRLTNQLAEESFRHVLAWYHKRRRRIVLFDRHFFLDYYAYDVVGDAHDRRLSQRVHGFMLDRVFPRPDLVILLDAPAQVLLSRKGEGTVESLERRRREYLDLRAVLEHFTIVDATRPLDDVTREVARVINEFGESPQRAVELRDARA